MRAVPSELRTRLATGVTTLAHAWRIRRRDDAVFGFTDHDRDLVFDGVTYRASSALASGAREAAVGLATDRGPVSGMLDDGVLTEADLSAGIWDGARVDVWRVDWTDPALRVHLFAGRLGEVRRGPVAFMAELLGLQASFDAAFGRVFSRFCDADVGDGRCGVDLDGSAYRGAGAVIALEGGRSFRAGGLSAFAQDWFARGVVTWGSGARSEVAAHHLSPAGVMIELVAATPLLVPGTAFTITAGCDKRFATCGAKFANTVNFRGFPHMPGNDAVIAGPDPAQPFDGGSRIVP